MSVFVRLLGSPRVAIDGRGVELPPTRVSAALLYLAYRSGWVRRDELLSLLWPERDEAHARASLRQLVAALRSTPYARGLEVERLRLRWPVDTDVGRWEAGSEVEPASGGVLLDAFHLRDASGFDQWLELERVAIRERLRRRLLERVERAREAGATEAARRALEGWLVVEPLDDGVVQLLLETCGRIGRHGEGGRAYRVYAERLRAEFGVEPPAHVRRARAALDEAAATSDTVRGSDVAPGPAAAATGGKGDPQRWSTPFVGRAAVLERVQSELGVGALVMLVGAGGMGKTRLAHEAARRLDGRIAGGVTVISAIGAATADEVLARLADARGAPKAAGMPVRQRADVALHGESALLVLDNLEQVDGIEPALADLARAHPGHAWLLTSRRRLALPGGVTIEVDALPWVDPDGARASPAVQLVLAAAERLGVTVPAAATDAVVRLVERLGGMPLALELAAGWLRLLPAEGLLERLEREGRLFAAPGTATSGRHASIDDVLEASWAALRSEEREALARLSVFTDGADVGAAESVAGVDPMMLAAVRDASMVSLSAEGRIVQHPLIRTFVARRAAEWPDALAAARARHAEHFLTLLERLEHAGQAGDGTAITTLAREHGNIEAAWAWAIEHERWAPLEWGGVMLGLSYWHVGRLGRWFDLIRAALARVPRDTQTWAVLEEYDADAEWWDGRHETAYARRRAALERLRPHRDPFRIAWALFHLSLTLAPLGRSEAARAALVEADTLLASIDEVHVRAMVVNHLHMRATDLAERKAWYRIGEEVRRRSGSPEYDSKAWLLRASDLVRESGAWSEALRLVDAAIALRRERLPDDIDTTVALARAAEFRIAAGDLTGALALARESLERGRPFGITTYFDRRWPAALAAEALWLQGEADEAKRLIEREVPPASGAQYEIEGLRVTMALEEGQARAARQALEAARASLGAAPPPPSLELLEARVALAEGLHERARASVVRALDAEAAAPSVSLALSILVTAAPLLPAALARQSLQLAAGHPGTAAPERLSASVRSAPPPSIGSELERHPERALRTIVAEVRAALVAEARSARGARPS